MAKKKKMKVGLYPGSFNPWHTGHEDVLDKALELFDKVIIAQGLNPLKPVPKKIFHQEFSNVEVITYDITLPELVDQLKPDAIIRGLRNVNDFIEAQQFQYVMEDLGIIVPFVHIICDKMFVHMSSTVLRAIDESEEGKKK